MLEDLLKSANETGLSNTTDDSDPGSRFFTRWQHVQSGAGQDQDDGEGGHEEGR